MAFAAHTPPVRSRSGDVSIFYRRFGQPGPMPVLIVHGLSYFSYDWISPAARIAADREVVAIDMRGFGKSDRSRTRDYKLETLSRDVVAVLDESRLVQGDPDGSFIRRPRRAGDRRLEARACRRLDLRRLCAGHRGRRPPAHRGADRRPT